MLQIPKAHRRLSATAALDQGVERLRYVRGKRAQAMERLGIATLRDLLLHVPHRYLDFSRTSTIADAEIGQSVTIIGAIDKVRVKRPRPRLTIVEAYVVDDTATMRLSFFRQPWRKDTLHEGDVLAFSGKVTFGYGYKQMTPSFCEVVGSTADRESYPKVLPVHGVTEGLSQAWMRRIVSSALADDTPVVDFLPAGILERLGLMGLSEALRTAHFPPSLDAAERARRRLAFDELLCLQLALRVRGSLRTQGDGGHVHGAPGPRTEALLAALPFALTAEQRRATDEIFADMAGERPMNRLLLGDVGTGKTAVAAMAVALAADSGFQAAVMAPTSVLAAQHAERLGPVLDAASIRWALLLGATPRQERDAILEALAAGELDCVFGTTALLSDDVRFRDLSLVVVDEQHRFGVDQRIALAKKGSAPDVLAMTATPIPRTLALSVYGDIETSRIRERPNPGAGVATELVPHSQLDRAYDQVREAVAAGHQAYVVCPLVDDGDEGPDLFDGGEQGGARLTSAVGCARDLSREIFPDLSVGLLHGRMSAAEKDEVMARFHDGAIDVLVTTTVVEVGVDVPNATCMVVLDADRFGLATLHQLRGRVGRGDVAGKALLVSNAKRGSAAYERLSALERTSDGFELAELDLRLRHEGDVLGYRQSGEVSLTLVDLVQDADLVERAHELAIALLARDPDLGSAEHALLLHEVRARYRDAASGGAIS